MDATANYNENGLHETVLQDNQTSEEKVDDINPETETESSLSSEKDEINPTGFNNEENSAGKDGGEQSQVKDEEDFDFCDSYSVKLLQGAVAELERALRDSRALMKSRDEEIVALRGDVEKGRDQVHKEQMKWQRKSAQAEERNREVQDLRKQLRESERTRGELMERIKEFESPFSEAEGLVSCCASMKELVEIKVELAEKDFLLSEIRKNNYPLEHVGKTRKADETLLRKTADECDRHNQLKLKFLRDAFFYFMIDFHSEEQIKAILAVLAYGDQREEVILEAFRMRQRGKKFFVKEVSTRGLSFLHEQN